MQRRILIAALLTGLVSLLTSSWVFAQGDLSQSSIASLEEISGALDDGTMWRLRKPEDWNGTLLLDLDGAGFIAGRLPSGTTLPDGTEVVPLSDVPGSPAGAVLIRRPSAFDDWLLARGFALGGITREPVGYDFLKAVNYLLDVRRRFGERWGMPSRTIVRGTSRGAFAVRMALELHPEIFDGGFMTAGGGAGEIAVLKNKLNGLFALKTLVDPAAPLKLVNIEPETENAALAALVEKAKSTRAGRARLALAAAIQQFAVWTNPAKPKPAPTDYEAQLGQIEENFVFATAVPVRAGIEKIAGGNVSWNTDVDYEALLRKSGRMAMVEYFYGEASLSLAGDLATLAAAPRIEADAAAVRRAEPLISYTGRIRAPVVNVDNDDPVDPASDKLAYLETLKRAGTEEYFRLIWTDVAGHARHSDLDRAVGFTVLVDRMDNGVWRATSVQALRSLAAEIAKDSPVDLGKLNVFDPGPIPAPSTIWDASSWGSYQRPIAE